jgi:phospholipid transport system substrate-binding protein
MKFLIMITGLAFALAGAPVYSQGNEATKLQVVVDAALDVLYLDHEDHEVHTDEQHQDAVRVILEENYDLVVIIRRALARNWSLMSAEEQVQVTDLITDLIVKAFVEGMDGLERPAITYGDVVEVTSKRLEIPVVVSFPDGDTFHVLYRLGRLQSGWQIYDIVGEDISMVSNYRQQFDDHFRKGNGAQLIEKLEKLLKEGELNEKTKI